MRAAAGRSSGPSASRRLASRIYSATSAGASGETEFTVVVIHDKKLAAQFAARKIAAWFTVIHGAKIRCKQVKSKKY